MTQPAGEAPKVNLHQLLKAMIEKGASDLHIGLDGESAFEQLGRQNGALVSHKVLREQAADSARPWQIASRAAPFWSRCLELRQSLLRSGRHRQGLGGTNQGDDREVGKDSYRRQQLHSFGADIGQQLVPASVQAALPSRGQRGIHLGDAAQMRYAPLVFPV